MSAQVAPTNRPDDTAFKQQRLAAWQPILTPLWVIMTFIVIAAFFIPIGIVLNIASNQIFEQVVYYDGSKPDVNCSITANNQGYFAFNGGTPMNCTITFTVTQDIPKASKVNVYYQLTNFYQNHRRYVKSRSDPQVGGQFVASSSLQTSCDPNASYVSSATGLIYAPCGLIATSFFNDRIDLESFTSPNPSTATVVMDETGIAWATDMSSKFKNPVNPTDPNNPNRPLNNWSTYQYLWQTYDQMSCIDDVSGSVVTCLKWGDLIPGAYGTGCAKCNPGSTARYLGGVPPPNGTHFDYSPSAIGNAMAPYGYRDEHFVVWMRTAGLPTFRKLYGVLVPPDNGFKKGDKITFTIVPNFEVLSFGGSKALVLSTVTATGGKSNVLSIAYLVVGSICLALAISFAIKHLVSPRKLGDPQYIVWRHAKQ